MAITRQLQSYTNSILAPVYNNVAYFYDNAQTYVKALHKKSISRGRYGRYHNPSWEETEKVLAQLDGTEACAIFPSGMSAIYSTLMAFMGSYSCCATLRYLYRNTRRVFEGLDSLGIKTLILDNADPALFAMDLHRVG